MWGGGGEGSLQLSTVAHVLLGVCFLCQKCVVRFRETVDVWRLGNGRE